MDLLVKNYDIPELTHLAFIKRSTPIWRVIYSSSKTVVEVFFYITVSTDLMEYIALKFFSQMSKEYFPTPESGSNK